ncbi:MAG: OmpA family protein [Thiobacillus sp.]|nr:OmpA family protein [Thiobacillus sp.]
MKAQTMKNNHFFALSLIGVAVMTGCSTMPQSTTLDSARVDYSNAQANPQVVELAPVQLMEAGVALDRANAAQTSHEDAKVVDSLAYVAKQKIALTQETAQRKNAELAVNNATVERNRLQLQARTNEADQAKQQTAMAQLSVAQKTAEANQARQQAADAQAHAAQDEASMVAMQIQMDEMNAKKTPRGMVITLGDVLFDTNQAQLKSGGARNVQKLAEFLKRYPQRKVLIEGFTDSVGSNSTNQVLSEQRANAVGVALSDMGVSRDRVSTKGYGEAYAVAGNDTASGRQLNRRVEIMLSDENGVIAPR